MDPLSTSLKHYDFRPYPMHADYSKWLSWWVVSCVEGGPLLVRIKGLEICYAMFMIRASNKFNPPSFTSQDSIIRMRRGFAHVEFGRVVGEVALGD